LKRLWITLTLFLFLQQIPLQADTKIRVSSFTGFSDPGFAAGSMLAISAMAGTAWMGSLS